MSFFDSEIIRSEIQEISELQDKIYKNILNFYLMSKEEKLNHINFLERLLDLQKIVYTRLSLSDDPEAIKMKESIFNSPFINKISAGKDINVVFDTMAKLIGMMRVQIDNNG